MQFAVGPHCEEWRWPMIGVCLATLLGCHSACPAGDVRPKLRSLPDFAPAGPHRAIETNTLIEVSDRLHDAGEVTLRFRACPATAPPSLFGSLLSSSSQHFVTVKIATQLSWIGERRFELQQDVTDGCRTQQSDIVIETASLRGARIVVAPLIAPGIDLDNFPCFHDTPHEELRAMAVYISNISAHAESAISRCDLESDDSTTPQIERRASILSALVIPMNLDCTTPDGRVCIQDAGAGDPIERLQTALLALVGDGVAP